MPTESSDIDWCNEQCRLIGDSFARVFTDELLRLYDETKKVGAQ